MSLGLFNCRLIQPARDQLFFFAGCLAAPVPVRASSVQSPCDASCSAPTSGRARNASCVFPSQEGFVLVFRGSEAPVGCRRVHPTDSPTNSPEDPPILPIDSAIEPVFVHDWRMIQEHRGKGDSIDPQVERAVRIGLLRFGHRYLTRQARDARAAGRALPTDPYMRNWYDERESEILRDAVRISCGTHTARFRSGTIGASGGLAASCHLTTRRGVLRCRPHVRPMSPQPPPADSSVFGKRCNC